MSDAQKPKSLSELMFTDDYRKRIENFDKDVEALNEKYADQLEPGDTLAKHVFIKYQNSIDDRTHFNIVDAEELPPQAQVEMRSLFAKHFDPRNKPK